MKGVSVIKRLSRMSPQYSLLTIYKSFVLLHFDYGDVLYDQRNNKEVYVKKKYSIQCCSCYHCFHEGYEVLKWGFKMN